MDDPALEAWIATSGLTRREVMMIQPNYRGRQPEWEMPRWHLIADAKAFFMERVAAEDVAEARRMAGVEAKLQLIDLRYRVLVGGEAAGANTLSGHNFYRAGLRAGAVPLSLTPDKGLHATAIVTAGATIDGIAGVVPRAISVPGALLISVDTIGNRSYCDSWHDLVLAPIVQLRAQGAWVAWGRAQAVAWTGGLDLVWRLNRWSDMTGDRFRPRDLIASVTVTKFAGTVYGGVALGIGAWSITEDRGPGLYPGGVQPPLGPYW
jgi:hypothetical protein